nr:DUF551 domain-containing protein [Oscillospiraceae bacterium]
MMLDGEMMEILKDMEDRYTEAAVILEGLEDDRFSRRAEALRLVREKLLLPDWNAVKDGLPDVAGWYLVFYNGSKMQVAFFNGKKWPFDNHYHKVTHWLPLPEPPEA